MPIVPSQPAGTPLHTQPLSSKPTPFVPEPIGHDAVLQTLDRFDYLGTQMATHIELHRIARLPNGAPVMEAMMDTAVHERPEVLTGYGQQLVNMWRSAGEPPALANAYANMGVRAAVLHGAFTHLAGMQHALEKQGGQAVAEQAADAAWRCAMFANAGPFFEKHGVFAGLQNARHAAAAAPAPAEVSTQTDPLLSMFVHEDLLGPSPSSLPPSSDVTPANVWPEDWGSNLSLMDAPGSPAHPRDVSAPQSPLFFHDDFSMFASLPTRSPSPAPRDSTPLTQAPETFAQTQAPLASRDSPSPRLSRPLRALVPKEAPPSTAPVAGKARVGKARANPSTSRVDGSTPKASGSKVRVDKPRKFGCDGGCGTAGCDKTYLRAEHLRRHRKTVRDIACLFPGCPKMFPRSDNMRQHFLTHSGAAAVFDVRVD